MQNIIIYLSSKFQRKLTRLYLRSSDVQLSNIYFKAIELFICIEFYYNNKYIKKN